MFGNVMGRGVPRRQSAAQAAQAAASAASAAHASAVAARAASFVAQGYSPEDANRIAEEQTPRGPRDKRRSWKHFFCMCGKPSHMPHDHAPVPPNIPPPPPPPETEDESKEHASMPRRDRVQTVVLQEQATSAPTYRERVLKDGTTSSQARLLNPRGSSLDVARAALL
ncbi:hypothetical protein CYMTET_45458 [Cymbomonas tetramitiformis]|uniref:Uncharacterized protein n=1 Tax=Cymbomonas tetramitiformis TaxID=36881 RepID=A0AAE0BZA9_9CHLO|nr:hypothetical protein CYMTET_45458 [Cymbomonas tetramitiformis]